MEMEVVEPMGRGTKATMATGQGDQEGGEQEHKSTLEQGKALEDEPVTRLPEIQPTMR